MSAWAVERLLRAGARLVGKTRTDELAYSLEGRNFHEGAPLNPAAPDRLTGGSSSGAASAVAAAEVDFALGSDTAGSIRVPAAWCGLVGFRPTHGRIPVDGLTPLAPSFDTVGWMARSASLMRTVGDVLLAGGAMPMPVPMSAVSLVRDPSVDRRCEAGKTAMPSRILERFAARGLAMRNSRRLSRSRRRRNACGFFRLKKCGKPMADGAIRCIPLSVPASRSASRPRAR